MFGPTTGPSDKLFKNLREKWGGVRDSINYQNLAGLDWSAYRGTALEQEANTSLKFCVQSLSEGVFPREDYKELVQLTTVWLGGIDQVSEFSPSKIYGKVYLHPQDGHPQGPVDLPHQGPEGADIATSCLHWPILFPMVSQVCHSIFCSLPSNPILQADD